MSTKMRDDSEQRMDVRLPAAKSAQTVQAAPLPSLLLSADGKVYFQDRLVTHNQLEMELRGLIDKGQYDIVIRGDERVNFGRVVELMDWCRLAGMKTANWEMRLPAAVTKAPGE